ncbi:MAG: biotin/lipoyl-binding protein [Clostridiales Family XIII bacterium]|jgi:biotin carboxyl carrier protein|nr:biotin/lipoyl-binding protein [Clostridiales Family XIII bacterium]
MAEVKSEIAGKIVAVNISVDDTIEDDDEIFLLEVMKMELTVRGGVDGTVKEILVAVGDTVEEGQTLAVIE